MGLELMLGGVMVAAGAFWRYVTPAGTGQVIVVVVVVAMAMEMALGLALVTAIFRAREVDQADLAADLKH